MNRFDNESTVQRMTQTAGVGKSKRRGRVSRVPGIPDGIDIIANRRDPENAEVEVYPLVLVVIPHEAEERRSGVDTVFPRTR